jgi:hypothetical protein
MPYYPASVEHSYDEQSYRSSHPQSADRQYSDHTNAKQEGGALHTPCSQEAIPMPYYPASVEHSYDEQSYRSSHPQSADRQYSDRTKAKQEGGALHTPCSQEAIPMPYYPVSVEHSYDGQSYGPSHPHSTDRQYSDYANAYPQYPGPQNFNRHYSEHANSYSHKVTCWLHEKFRFVVNFKKVLCTKTGMI